MLRPYKCKKNRKRRRGRTEVRPYKQNKSAGLKTRHHECKKNRKRRRGRTEIRPYRQNKGAGLKTRSYKHGGSPIMMRLQKCLQNAPIGIWRQTG